MSCTIRRLSLVGCLWRVVLAAVLLKCPVAVILGDAGYSEWKSWLQRNKGEGPLGKGQPASSQDGIARHCQAPALNESESETANLLVKGMQNFDGLMRKLEELQTDKVIEREQMNRCAILVHGDNNINKLMPMLSKYVNQTAGHAHTLAKGSRAGASNNRIFVQRLFARRLLACLKPVMWFAACEDSQQLLKTVLLLFHYLDLEQERLCIVRWSLVVLEGITARQPKKEPDLRVARFRAELMMMDEPVWNPDEVEKMLGVMPPRTRAAPLWHVDGSRTRLQKFLRTANASQVGSRERNKLADRLKHKKELGDLEPALRITQIPRRRAKELSFVDFYSDFAEGRKPVVIEGLDFGLASANSWFEIQQICGHIPIKEVKRMERRSLEPANMAVLKTTPTHLESWMDFVMFDADFSADSLDNDPGGNFGDASDADPKWLGSMLYQHPLLEQKSSEEKCPKLMNRLVVPRYFAGDFMKRTSWYNQSRSGQRDLLRDSPSISVMPRNTSTGWQHTRLGAHSWHLLLHGHQLWRFVPVSSRRDRALWFCEHPTLRYEFGLPSKGISNADVLGWQPTWYSSVYPKDVEVSCPSWVAGTSRGTLKIVEIELLPGEVLFVPSGMPYQVKNVKRSLAISSSYVDASNLEDFLSEAATEETVKLARTGKKTPLSLKKKIRDIRKSLFGNELPPMLLEPSDLAWSDYARGPRPWEANLKDDKLLSKNRTACAAPSI